MALEVEAVCGFGSRSLAEIGVEDNDEDACGKREKLLRQSAKTASCGTKAAAAELSP
jgi:hypothetical protein